jgi:hypothetical protein
VTACRNALALLLPLVLVSGCASAGDRLNEGIELQSRGRYIQAVYRYAEALERDAGLVQARDRLLAAGDTAIMVAMDDAEELERRGDPVGAARQYRDVDQMLGRVRQVGVRLDPPADYGELRRAIFDRAIGWQMVHGDAAAEAGQWSQARDLYVGARADFLQASRVQVEESYDAETRVLLAWAEVELGDARPRTAHGLAQSALAVRSSPARDVVLRVRDIQQRAIDQGTVVAAMLPVTATPGVRDHLGPEFEIQLDDDLSLDHWNRPPLFVQVADPIILRRELRGILRGQVQQSPTLVGRALELIGADLGVMVELSRIRVTEENVRSRSREVVVPRPAAAGRGVNRRTDQPMDTVTFSMHEGTLAYFLEANVVLVDRRGREVERFSASSSSSGPFQRGEFGGDPTVLPLRTEERPFFDPSVLSGQVARIEEKLLEDLAVAVAAGTFDTVLSGID